MNFFIPEIKEGEDADKHREKVKDAFQDANPWSLSDKKIFSLHYKHDGKEYNAIVGEEHPYDNDLVILIFEFIESGGGCLIFTPSRCIKLDPIIVGKNDIISVKEF